MCVNIPAALIFCRGPLCVCVCVCVRAHMCVHIYLHVCVSSSAHIILYNSSFRAFITCILPQVLALNSTQ